MTNRGRPTLALVCLMLAACGGGDGQVSIRPEAPLAYSNTADTRYTYTRYQSWSHVSAWNRGDVKEIYIGGDWQPRESLRHVATLNEILFYMGASRDGTGVERLKNYRHDLETLNDSTLFGQSKNGFKPFTIQPQLFFDPDLAETENSEIFGALGTPSGSLMTPCRRSSSSFWVASTIPPSPMRARLRSNSRRPPRFRESAVQAQQHAP